MANVQAGSRGLLTIYGHLTAAGQLKGALHDAAGRFPPVNPVC